MSLLFPLNKKWSWGVGIVEISLKAGIWCDCEGAVLGLIEGENLVEFSGFTGYEKYMDGGCSEGGCDKLLINCPEKKGRR